MSSLPHASGGGPHPQHRFVQCLEVFPTLVGVVRRKSSIVLAPPIVFPTLVGVVRYRIRLGLDCGGVFPTLVGVVREGD